MIGIYTPYAGGIKLVRLVQDEVIPDSVDFEFHHATINVNFWLVQALRKATGGDENKINFIKAIRLTFTLGLKEAKDIAEWFLNNVHREVAGKL